MFKSPIVLDLDGAGIRTLSVSQGVRFDIDGDGRVDQTGWAAQGEGILARDLSGDGKINDGSELFGTATRLSDGSFASDGFEALAALDTNADGKIDASDPLFADLKVWVDADSDGVTDPGELKSLDEAGVRSIQLNPNKTTQFDEGNLIGLASSFETTDGETRDAVDVWFRVSRSEELDQQASVLGDALKSFEGAGDTGDGDASLDRRTVERNASETQGETLAPLQPAELARALREFDLHRGADSAARPDEKSLGGIRQPERERRVEPTLGQAFGPGAGGLGGGGAGDD